ncbi:MAG: GIY-YIG nuclease family protein [Pseudomonadota bacterium]
MAFYVFILASQKNGTLYTGHTDDLDQRILDHRDGRGVAFTRKYRVTRLVWVEDHDTRDSAKWRDIASKRGNGRGKSG